MPRKVVACWFATLLALAAAPAAKAASLQQVNNWGVNGLPSDVTMYIYVPDNVAANPPVLALIHYCGGTAAAVFGQAQGGGIVRAADQYGFIMVVPSSGRCWDVQSNKTRTRDGMGDSHAIAQMVRYAIQNRNGNAQRVYATGDSSGGMMTELLLAVYPDLFKAGAAFAGMPAGCRAANETGNGGGYSGACAGGSVTHTPQEWGDIARMLDPGYAGHRPRVQLFHGDMDTTIRYANHTEAIKEWTNVLGLGTSPTSSTTVTLGNHQATRQRWQSPCGFTVLDTFTSIGGDHGPSDALFPSQYVIPFLGLDNTGAVDPEILQCGMSGGMGGAGGGGAGGAGGRSAGGAGGSGGGASAGAGGIGGLGNAGVGGSFAGSANAGPGGAEVGGAGGMPEAGGASPSGGSPSGGSPSGGSPSGGVVGTGGTLGMGGSTLSGGTASGPGGAPNQGGSSSGASGASPALTDDSESSGCGCKLVGANPTTRPHGGALLLAVGLALVSSLRRRRN